MALRGLGTFANARSARSVTQSGSLCKGPGEASGISRRKVGRDAFADLVTDFLAGDENNIADKTLRARAQSLDWA
jgi:hypothetical protein